MSTGGIQEKIHGIPAIDRIPDDKCSILELAKEIRFQDD